MDFFVFQRVTPPPAWWRCTVPVAWRTISTCRFPLLQGATTKVTVEPSALPASVSTSPLTWGTENGLSEPGLPAESMVNFHRCETQALRSNEAATKLWSEPSLASDSTSCPAGNVTVPAGAPFAELKVCTTSTNAGVLVWCRNLWRCRLVPWDGGLALVDCEMIPAKNAGAVDGCPLPVAGPVTLAVARLAVPATTPAAS